MSDENSAVKTLVQESLDDSQLEVIFTEDSAKEHIKSYTRDCPLLYSLCSQNRTIDSNCIGDSGKFTGCHTFIELGVTAPPKTNKFYTINWEKGVVEQLRKIKEVYETLENNCRTQEKAVEAAKQRYEQAEINLQNFKNEFGPRP